MEREQKQAYVGINDYAILGFRQTSVGHLA